jgi:hypothetical protein
MKPRSPDRHPGRVAAEPARAHTARAVALPNDDRDGDPHGEPGLVLETTSWLASGRCRQAARSGLERGEIGWRDLSDREPGTVATPANFHCNTEDIDSAEESGIAAGSAGHLTDSAWLSLLLVPRTV